MRCKNAGGDMAVKKARTVRKKAPEKRRLNLTVNGQPFELEVGIEPDQVDPAHTLAHTLRETLGLTGTKVSCDHGACGCCTVLMDGKAVLSCMTLTVECDGKQITTIEGLSDPKTGKTRSPSAGIHRLHSLSVRILHTRHDHERKGAPSRESIPHGRRGEGRSFGQLLPVYQPLPGGEGRYGSIQRGEVSKMANTYRYIGKATPRKDATEIVTGGAEYLNDIKIPGMLYGKVLRSPHPHALIKKVDKSKAERLPGVKAVLTWEDVPDWKGGTPRYTRVLDRKVRYVGDAVALVAATTEEIAKEALQPDRRGI